LRLKRGSFVEHGETTSWCPGEMRRTEKRGKESVSQVSEQSTRRERGED